MKDPKVTKLVTQFQKEIESINKTWKQLQDNNVYVRIDTKGTNSYDALKYFEITDITQHVGYMKDPK